MSRTFGGQTMYGRLRRVLVRRPDAAFGHADPGRWHYAGPPDLDAARAEHDKLVDLLVLGGAEVAVQEECPRGSADSLFTHDPSFVTDRGAIVLRMGKPERRDEPDAAERCLERLGMPILHRLAAPSCAEGGDLLWIAPDTLAVGLGARTNERGLREVAAVLAPLGVDVLPVRLPPADDPRACMHLMSFVSCVDRDLAVVYPPLLPRALECALDARGYELVEVPRAEYRTLGANVLALGPRDCVLLEDNPVTAGRLRLAGCRVRTYRGREISLKAEGGPTCLTRPLLRDA